MHIDIIERERERGEDATTIMVLIHKYEFKIRNGCHCMHGDLSAILRKRNEKFVFILLKAHRESFHVNCTGWVCVCVRRMTLFIEKNKYTKCK